MARSFDFAVWLKGSEAEQKAESERQVLALASHGRGHLSEAERLIGRGALLEKTAQANLNSATDDETRTLAMSQLADAQAMQGKYAEAAEAHPDLERKKYFEGVVAAIEMPDDAKCGCPDNYAKTGDIGIAVTPRFERDRIFSPVHGQTVSLVECVKCGHQNARPLRSRLLTQQAAQHANEQAKGGRLISDVQVLNANPK